MDKTQNLVQYKIFKSYKKLVAFTTTKQTLKEKSPRFTGDAEEIINKNKKQLASQIGIKADQLIFPRQTHTNCVAEVSDFPEKEIKETDALITDKTGICLCVQTADCVPILLFDPTKNVISAVHAGWRGTVNKIVEIAVQKMVSDYKCSPENILVAIGPSISPEVYEVGSEVVEAVRKSIPNAAKTLTKNSLGKFHFNLWEANKQLLTKAGVLPKNIEISGECSFIKNHKYYSARKDGIETGRMVSGMMLIG